MRLWQAKLFIGVSCLAAAGMVRAADVNTAPQEDKHYVEIPLGRRPLVAAPVPTSAPTPAPAAPAPAAQPPVHSSPEIDSLLRQLGDADFRQREAAVARLKEIGPSALPALERARDAGGDPEVVSRADGVIRFFEHPPVPGRSGGSNVNMRFSVENGANRVEVREPKRFIRIDQDVNGIRMSVTGEEGGKEVTREYQARTPEDLQRQNPDAFELFKRWTGAAAHGGADRGFRAAQRREMLRLQLRGGPQLLPLARPGQGLPRPGDDARELLRRQLEILENAARANGAANVDPPAKIQKFLDQLEADREAARREADALEKRLRATEKRAAEPAEPEKAK